MKRIAFIVAAALLALCGPMANGQITSSSGNLEVYSHKTVGNEFGLLRTTIVFPASGSVPDQFIRQQGILFTHTYNLGTFDPIVISMSDQVTFGFEGAFRMGVGIGSEDLGQLWGPFTKTGVKYYVAVLDPFSVDVGPSYTHMFRNGTGITAKCGITIIDIGATGAMMQNGTLKDNGILIANILPVQVSGSVFFDFGRSGLGVQYFINASNLISYVVAPGALYSEDNRGIVSRGLIRKYSIQLLYTY
jgi:hypothetical protein